MFAGHYGVSLAAKKVEPKAPLGLLFLAAQFVDILWALFMQVGIEKVQVDPKLPSSPLRMTSIGYTHSLVAALGWSGVAYVIVRYLPIVKDSRYREPIALVTAVVVFSHWVLDIIMHRSDMGLWFNSYKIGLGLWNYSVPAFLFESATLLAGLWIYLRSTTASTFGGRYGMVIFTAVLLLINAATYWVAPPTTNAPRLALFNLSCYIIFAAIAAWLDGKRSPKAVSAQQAAAQIQPS